MKWIFVVLSTEKGAERLILIKHAYIIKYLHNQMMRRSTNTTGYFKYRVQTWKEESTAKKGH